ncbi:hypothetical protein NDA13_004074 [Ustilago tritici]|nr:hypothetical protein NDA13_004074 [Ustilago tritici]
MSHQAAALASLFSQARLTLKVPSASKSVFRSVVYFDEVLNVEAILTLPSHPLLPIASSSTHEAPFVQPLPLSALSARAQLGQQNIPPYLNALLACLHVNLYTDYVPPPTPSSQVPSRSINPYEPLSTVQLQFEHLQLLPSHAQPSDPAHAQHAPVRAFSNSWAGNQPPQPHRTLKDSADSSSSPLSTLSSHHAHLTHDGQHWRVHWHCRVPINFIATPFSPLLSITAALTLRLDDALLDQYIPNSSSRSFIRSGFAHSLLAPLHEGPVYPDESPLQSQARANASSALGLDGPNGLGSYLAHLPRDVVGGNNAVVTPRSGAQALNTIQQRRNDALSVDTQHRPQLPKPDSNGDLAVLSPRSASGSILTTSASSQGTSRSSGLGLESEDYSSGLQIYKRSTREVLPLKTALNVRMRTLITQHDPFIYRRPSSHQPLAQLESSRLVLSVELENPFESDSTFAVKDIQIKINPTSANDQQDAHNVVAKALEPMSSVLPIELTRGSQHNLLFYVYVDSDHALHSQSASSVGGGVDRSTSARNLTITVSSQPRGGPDKQALADFDSQWNCALDLAPVLSDAAKKSFIASGSRLASTAMHVAVSEGPLAGNKQYSASALRSAARQADNRNTYQQAGRRGGDRIEDIRTPRPGHLGLGFPPPMRTSSARYFSSAATIVGHIPDAAQDDGGFLQKAKARAASHQSLSTPLNHKDTVETQIKPWMDSSSSTVSPSAAATRGALVILSTLRRADSPPNTHKPGELGGSTLEPRPTLGEEGVALPSVSTNAKLLHPVCIAPPSVATGAARDGRGGVSVQTGDTIVVHLTLLHKALAAEAIRNIVFSWSTPLHHRTEPATRANRDSIDTDTRLTKARLMDAHTTRLQSSLSSSQPESTNSLIPLQDHLVLHEVLTPGQCSKVALALRCLSPGYHTLPSLKISFQADTGTSEAQEVVLSLERLGAVFVGPAAVL